jgi:hypothetical protein
LCRLDDVSASLVLALIRRDQAGHVGVGLIELGRDSTDVLLVIPGPGLLAE